MIIDFEMSTDPLTSISDIEITPDMIAAGVQYYVDCTGDSLWAEQTVREIYLRMFKVSPFAGSPSARSSADTSCEASSEAARMR